MLTAFAYVFSAGVEAVDGGHVIESTAGLVE